MHHNIYRLGRDKNAIKDELRFFKKKGVIVHILNFPQTMLEINDDHQKSVMELVNNLLIEVFSFIAQEERENICRRQAEGIALWRKTGKTKTGRPYGRPKTKIPSNWEKIYSLWKDKKLKTKDAWYLLKISKNVFYRLVKEYEAAHSH
ncbi:MAG: recombinase family protein [Selenomonadaceae bacterium]|nr:recombinase family protein [Selenomonadaceae bacterium]